MNGYNNYMGTPNNFMRPSMGINWVNGPAEVETMELPPGQMAVFLDRQNDGMMYIRSRDTYNVYKTQTFKIEEMQPAQPESPYVTRDELKSILQEIMGGTKNEPLRQTDGETADKSADKSAGGKR